MTWDMTIGKMYREDDIEDGYLRVRMEYNVAAPTWDGDQVTGHSNNRGMGYTYADHFMSATGLERYTTREGTYPLNTEEYLFLVGKLKAYKAAHPDAVAGWDNGKDDLLARLIWMQWWMYYALGKYGDKAGISFH